MVRAFTTVLLLFQTFCLAQSVSLTYRGAWPGFPSGDALTVTVVSNVAYVVGPGLQIFDVQNPTQPVRLSGSPLKDSFGVDIAVTNGHAYIIDETGRLLTFDVTNPTNPVFLSLTWADSAFAVELSENYCYVSTSVWNGSAFEGRLRIFDVSDPKSPEFVADAMGSGRVCVMGDHAYLASGTNGLVIVNIANPASPFYVRRAATVGYANDVHVRGTIAYVATSPSQVQFQGGLEIFDVSDPAAPIPLGKLFGMNAQRVCVAGTTAYITCPSIGDNAFAIDVSDPGQPSLAGTQDLGYPHDVQVVNGIAYIPDHSQGLQILDVSDPSNMQIIATARTRWVALSVDVEGNYAYLVNEEAGMEILDVSDPDSPVRIGHYETDIPPLDVRVAGNYAYVAVGPYLDIVDIQNPSQPVRIGRHVPGYPVPSLILAGDYAFAPAGLEGLRVIDISNPTNLVPVGGYDTSGFAVAVRVVGSLAYVADNADGLQIIDVSNPAAPFRLGRYITTSFATAVDVVGNYAYLAVWPDKLEVIDVSQPQSPQFLGEFQTYGPFGDVQVVGNLAYLADLYSVRVIDVSNPTNLVLVAEQSLPDVALDLKLVGDMIYIADSYWGLSIVQVTFPMAINPPVLVGGMLELGWNGGPGIKLQKTTSLSNPDWQDVPGSEGVSSLTLPASGPSSFFRLCK